MKNAAASKAEAGMIRCGKCGKVKATQADMGERGLTEFRVCFCGVVGQRLFHKLFPQYDNMRPRPRRVRTRQQRHGW